jgi:hypothetical protein
MKTSFDARRAKDNKGSGIKGLFRYCDVQELCDAFLLSDHMIPVCHDAPLISSPASQPEKSGTATGFTEPIREQTALPHPFCSTQRDSSIWK